MVAGPGLEPGALNRDNLRRDAQCGEGDAGGVGEFGKGGGVDLELYQEARGEMQKYFRIWKEKVLKALKVTHINKCYALNVI